MAPSEDSIRGITARRRQDPDGHSITQNSESQDAWIIPITIKKQQTLLVTEQQDSEELEEIAELPRRALCAATRPHDRE